MHVRRLATVVVVALPLLFTSGCGNDPIKPKPFETPMASTSPTPTQPVTPQAESPEQFIRRWQRLSNEMQTSGDTTRYRAVNLNCSSCERFADQIDSIYRDGGYVHTRGGTVQRVRRVGGPRDRPQLRATVRSSPTSYLAVKGGDVESLPGGRNTYLITLKIKSGEWFVTDYAEVSR